MPSSRRYKKKSYERSIIIGTDCPGIDAALIEDAFEVLKKKDIVIGRAWMVVITCWVCQDYFPICFQA